jgi:hypothetical protein
MHILYDWPKFFKSHIRIFTGSFCTVNLPETALPVILSYLEFANYHGYKSLSYINVLSNGTGGGGAGCEWYQSIGLIFLNISADFKNLFN